MKQFLLKCWKEGKWGILVVLFALLVRSVSLVLFWHSLESSREWGFFTLIEHWFQGYGYSFATQLGCASAYRSPGFLFFLTAVYWVFGFPNFFAQAVIQNLVAVLISYLVYRLGWRLTNDRRVGIIAGLLITLHPYTFYHYTQYYHTGLASAFLVGLLLALCALERTKQMRWAWVAGILVAGSAYIQGTMLPAMPFMALWLVWRWRKEWKRAVIAVLIMAGTSIVLIAPWTYRNWTVFHRFVPFTTDLGLAAYKANTENYPRLLTAGYPHEALEEEASSTNPLYVRYHYLPEIEAMLEQTGGMQDAAFWTQWHPIEPKTATSCAALSPMNEADQNTEWMDLAKEWYTGHPADGIRLQAMKAYVFWRPSLYPSIRYGAPWSFGNTGILALLARYSLTLFVGTLELFALGGLYLVGRRKQFGVFAPMLITFGTFTVMHSLFAPYTKYRIPLDNFLAILAAITVVAIIDRCIANWKRKYGTIPSSSERIRSVERFQSHLPAADSLVIIPTYNERENIDAIIRAVESLPTRIDVMIVDDGSPDKTAELVHERSGASLRRTILMRRGGKYGLGTAYLDAFAWVLANAPEYRVLIQMDADFSHDPAMLSALSDAANEKGVAIGSRYIQGGSSPDWEWSRFLISWVGNTYANAILHLGSWSYGVKDSTAGFVAYRRDVLAKILEWSIYGQGYAYQISMKYAASRLGSQPVEVPITFRDRRVGKSKMNRNIVLEAIGVPWRLLFEFKKQPHD